MKSHVDNFDVHMGPYNSAQVADLIGIYILDMLGLIVLRAGGALPGWWNYLHPG